LKLKDQAVIMLGDINVDNIWPVPAIPQPGRDGLVDSVKMESGGAILNSSIVLDRLGVQTVLLGCVGEDIWADYLRRALAETQIDLSALQTSSKENSGLDFILVTPDGERTMFGYRGANKWLDPQKITPALFQDAGMLHISGYALLEAPQSDAALRAVQFASDRNIPVSIDTGLEPVMRNKAGFLAILPALAICISGVEEVEQLLGAGTAQEAAEKLVAAGVSLAAIKLGSEGSLLMRKGERMRCPSFAVDVVDTTGAGDAFSAGLVYGYLQGLSLGASGMLASALGALAAMVDGAGFSLPGREELIRFLAEAEWPETKDNGQAHVELNNHLK
jgi:ribokinase